MSKPQIAVQHNTDAVMRNFDLQLFAEGGGAGADSEQGTGGDPGAGAGTGAANAAGGTEPGSGAEQQKPGILTGVKGQGQQSQEGQEPGSPQAGAPETYKEFTVPEGFTYDKESAAQFSAIARELNLSQEQAQKLVDYHAAQLQTLQQAQANQVEGWYNDSIKRYKPEDIALANRTLSRFADQEFIGLLAETGLSNHPKVIGLFKSIGSLIAEGKFIDTQAVPDGGKPLYSNSPDMYK